MQDCATHPIPGRASPAGGRAAASRIATLTGVAIRDEEIVARIRSLAIPPAWTDVWICPSPLGHIQATGRDARGRKQYRYHPRWRTRRDAGKFERMLEFADALPAIRARCDADLAPPGLPREKVLAAVVRLLELTLIRVGNDEYARLNKSFGLTTLKDRHAVVEGSRVHFRFRGKTGQDPARSTSAIAGSRGIVRRCQELPGQELFQYVDDDGEVRDVASDDVNAYLREASGGRLHREGLPDMGRNVAGVPGASAPLGPADGDRASRKNVLQAIREVADGLGNTPTVAKGSYVHPAVVDAYLEGSLRGRAPRGDRRGGDASRAADAGRGTGDGGDAPAAPARTRTRGARARCGATPADGGGASERHPGRARQPTRGRARAEADAPPSRAGPRRSTPAAAPQRPVSGASRRHRSAELRPFA